MQLYMPHALAGPIEKANRVVQRRTKEEAHVGVGAEGIDIAKRRVPNARRGMPIGQQLADIVSARAHPLEPWPHQASQLVMRL